MALIEDENDPVLKMIFVTKRNEDETLLQIREYPSFKVLYELRVTI
jgi:hypothetical protein